MLLEGNARLLTNPELLRKSPTYEGYLAIILASKKNNKETKFVRPLSDCFA